MLVRVPHRPYRVARIAEQIEVFGVRSVPVIALSSAAIGMIFTLQTTALLKMFQAEFMVGAGVALANARELAPLITALMLIAKNGSSMTAELGTMRVTEQIDALETMSVDPLHYLVVPRLIAALVVFPLLTGLANVVGVAGSMFVATVVMNVDPGAFMDQIYWVVRPIDVYSGLMKAVVMGFMVTVICAYYGFTTRRGSREVGEASTRAVVTSSVSVLVADYFMADLMVRYLYGAY